MVFVGVLIPEYALYPVLIPLGNIMCSKYCLHFNYILNSMLLFCSQCQSEIPNH